MAGNTTNKDERINQINRRVEELDQLLAKFVQPSPAENPQTVSSAEMDYWSDRREERHLLLEELEQLLQDEEAP